MTDLAPLCRLRVRTPRLELRLGTHEELVELGLRSAACTLRIGLSRRGGERLEPCLPLFGAG